MPISAVLFRCAYFQQNEASAEVGIAWGQAKPISVFSFPRAEHRKGGAAIWQRPAHE